MRRETGSRKRNELKKIIMAALAVILRCTSLRLCQKYFDMASNNTLANSDEKLSSERFLSFTDDDVEKVLEAEENKTLVERPTVIAFLLSENENRRLEDLPPPELDVYLGRFALFCR